VQTSNETTANSGATPVLTPAYLKAALNPKPNPNSNPSVAPAAKGRLNPVKNFYGLTLNDLATELQGMGKEKFRAGQLYKWVFEKRVTDFEQMLNVSKEFRKDLHGIFSLDLPTPTAHLKSTDGTQKFLFKLEDGYTVEAVLIPSEGRETLCVSSEVGCNMACAFCFTGKQKLKRRLRADEIVGQFMMVEDMIKKDNPVARITNVVFMGMGEPLDNPDEVFRAIDILHEPTGRNFSRRKFTVSTSGLVNEMWRIAASKTRLAVSLNAYDDEVRSKIMPINKKFPLKMLLEECVKYTQETGDRVTFEYVLLKGVTDQIEHARKVWALVRHIPCKINIIPFNEHPGSEFQRPDDAQVEKFHAELMRLGAHVLLRRTMGRDIFAACGQLTSEFANKPATMDISNSKLGGRNRV
jgi:23S rRNA (adenine2503-C2)-methyltransferase